MDMNVSHFRSPANCRLHNFCCCFSLLTGVRTITLIALVFGGGFMFLAFEIGFGDTVSRAISICCTIVGAIFCFWFLVLLLLQSGNARAAQKLTVKMVYCLAAWLMFSFFLFIIMLQVDDNEQTLTVIAILVCFLAFLFSLYSIWILKVYFITLEEIEHFYNSRDREEFKVVQVVAEVEARSDLAQESKTSTLSRLIFPDLKLDPRVVNQMEKKLSRIHKVEENERTRSMNPPSNILEEVPSYETITVFQRKSPKSTRNFATSISEADRLIKLYSLNKSTFIVPSTSQTSEQSENVQINIGIDNYQNFDQEKTDSTYNLPTGSSETEMINETQKLNRPS